MEGWSGYKHPDPPYWLHWIDGVYLSYRIPAREMVKADSVSLHEYARHLLSSQVFAFNLFLPFQEAIRQHPLWNLGRCDRPYVRFRSAHWVAYEELSLDGWPFFLVLFEVLVTDNGVSLYLSLCQGGDDFLRRRIYDRVKERGDLFNGPVSAYSDQYIKFHETEDILVGSDYEDWWDKESIQKKIGSRLDAFARGTFPKINEVILNALEELRSAGGG